MMPRRTPHLLRKSRMFVNTTSKVALTTANWIRILTELSNLNGKVEYLSLALPLNILFLLLVFIGFNTCKVRFGISYTITIIVQAIVNTLGDCDLQEKVVYMTNVHEHNDVTVSLKVQQFRSRCVKSVYYNRTRVVCECRGYKRDREPRRVLVRMLKRLSQKIRKLLSYVRSRLGKNVPKLSKVHDLIKNNAT